MANSIDPDREGAIHRPEGTIGEQQAEIDRLRGSATTYAQFPSSIYWTTCRSPTPS